MRRFFAILIHALLIPLKFVIGAESDNSDFTKSAVKFSEENVGNLWGIGKQDYQRYEELKSGIRGTLSPNLDPLSALGIKACNDTERRHFAELWVKQEYERTEKELKFQREVDAAWKRLMPNMLPVNMSNAAGIAHDSGGRLALFVR